VVFGEVRLSRNTNGGGNSRAALDPNVLGKGVPGKAQAPGRDIPFFGLPGNPVSAMLTFYRFARALLQAFVRAASSRLTSSTARLKEDFKTKTGLTRFLPAILEGGLKDPEVEHVPWQGSGDLLASARANCYLVIPPDCELIPAGEMVTVLLR